jgi:hypothetical protein
MDGQDPAFPPGPYTNAPSLRSWHAPLARSHVYYWGACSSMVRAIQDGIGPAGIDVMNISSAFEGIYCNSGYDCSNLNATIRTATDAGMLIVKAAGNYGALDCGVQYPAGRPELLTVGGVDDGPFGYPDAKWHPSSSKGKPLGKVAGSTQSRAFSGLALMAPYVSDYIPDVLGPSSYRTAHGTSYSSPMVAGAAADLRQALRLLQISKGVDWAPFDARKLFTMMLVMGDGEGGEIFFPPLNESGMNELTGAGKVRMHWPDDPDLAAPWGWGLRSFTILNGQTVSWAVGSIGPEPAGVSVWKAAMTWFETNLNAMADIDIEVWDVCANQLMAKQIDFDTRNRLGLKDSSKIVGRCLEVRVHGFTVPSGGRTVYVTDYFASGDASFH